MESRTEDAEDSRNVMVKILVPGSDETRNRVILATNNQTGGADDFLDRA